MGNLPNIASAKDQKRTPTDLERQFLVAGPQLVRMLDRYDLLKLAWHEPYELWWQARGKLKTRDATSAEALPEWETYLAARQPADDLEDEIRQIWAPFEDLASPSLLAIVLNIRVAMYLDEEDQALGKLRDFWKRDPLCA